MEEITRKLFFQVKILPEIIWKGALTNAIRRKESTQPCAP